jgi:anti-anti-sigma factor
LITSTTHGERLEISIEGPLTHRNIDDLPDEILVAVKANPAQGLTLNLAGVTDIDSSGLGALIKIWKSCKALGLETQLTNPRPTVATALRMARVTTLIHVLENGNV